MTVSYSCKQCIIDYIAACGPQEMSDLRIECRTQAHDYSVENVNAAVNDMVASRELIVDTSWGMTNYELPE